MRDSDRRLTVGVNAYFALHPLTGSGQYLSHLLSALKSVVSDCQLSLWYPSQLGRASDRPDGRPERGLSAALAKLCYEQFGFPAMASGRTDVLHYPYWAAPLRCSAPVVVTVHDLIPLLLRPYRGTLLARAYSALVARATRKATLLIADSRATKDDIVLHLGIPAERVRVIYLAADPAFRPLDDAQAIAAKCNKYGLGAPFVFYVGGLDRRKNVDRLLEAFARARPALSSRYLLAIAGDQNRTGVLFPDLPALARRLGIEDDVRFLGVVPEADLSALYQAATAAAFPSSYEGFGLPPLEALASGTAVICSNSSSLPEVVGSAALLIDPRDTDDLCTALVRVLNDRDLRQELSRRGPSQASRFSWHAAALETVDVYREAIGRWKAGEARGS